jgi:hypothetical protein
MVLEGVGQRIRFNLQTAHGTRPLFCIIEAVRLIIS